MKRVSLLLVGIFIIAVGKSADNPRTIFSINESWRFLHNDSPAAMHPSFDDSKWDLVRFPHTWNGADAVDDTPGYYRGIAWYRHSIFIPADRKENQVALYFEGANQEVELFINGKSVGKHVGGYTRFSFEITSYLRFGEKNIFAIKVNNSYNENIPPLSADFTFFGGIYRDVYLIYTGKQHLSTTHYASSGVYITTPAVNAKQARISIKTLLTNADTRSKRIRVENTIVDPNKNIATVHSSLTDLPGKSDQIAQSQILTIGNPELWSPESPALYTVYTRLYDAKSNTLLDEVIQPLGLRWFEITAEKGFILNGKPCKLIGTNRHQCYEAIGNALPDEMHIRDIKLLKAMGGNFLRISHYPQDPTVMEMCDKLGIICSVEIPIVNGITENGEFTRNCLEMAREMVFQDFNRPSVLIWAYMNEVLLKLPFKENAERNQKYFSSVYNLASQIDKQIRQDDPGRYTLIPFHGNFKDYNEAGLTRIPMIVGWNLYQGWYGGSFDKFDEFLDSAQAKLRGKPFIITEYGADVDPRLHSFEPARFDYTAEYANLYHEHYIKAIMERRFVVGANIWNLNDFYSEDRANAVPHVNNKGITTLTRELKDTYLQYQAMFNKQPAVYIGGSGWRIRGGNADTSHTCKQPVKVYSNMDEVELFLNGLSLDCQKVAENRALFEVPFINGNNLLEAVGRTAGKTVKDMLKIDFRLIAGNLKDKTLPFNEINVMLGSRRYFEDKANDIIWIPEKEYTPGSWGFIGGKQYVKRTRSGQQPASDLNIPGTDDDPVYQTMRTDIDAFKLDVPDGQYTISLYWAELQSKEEKKALVYNLGDDALKEDFSDRIFGVSINGKHVLSDLNLAQEYGERYPVIKKFVINTSYNQGITIDFHPGKGEPMLNAIRVYRNY